MDELDPLAAPEAPVMDIKEAIAQLDAIRALLESYDTEPEAEMPEEPMEMESPASPMEAIGLKKKGMR